MADDFNTFDTDIKDPLLKEQEREVAAMRSSLLCSAGGDLRDLRYALTNVTILRIYHQVTRIVRYLDLMDKLEEKLYEGIESAIDKCDPENLSSVTLLLGIQEKLQKNLVASHELLKPYLTEDMMDIYSSAYSKPIDTDDNTSQLLDKPSREKLRQSAQQILLALEEEGGDEIKNASTNESQ